MVEAGAGDGPSYALSRGADFAHPHPVVAHRTGLAGAWGFIGVCSSCDRFWRSARRAIRLGRIGLARTFDARIGSVTVCAGRCLGWARVRRWLSLSRLVANTAGHRVRRARVVHADAWLAARVREDVLQAGS